MIERVQDVPVKAQGYLEWGRLLNNTDYEAARARTERAVHLVRAAGLKDLEAESLHLLGRTFSRGEDWEQVILHYEHSL